MKTTVHRWLPAIARNRFHIALLGLAAAAVIGGVTAGPEQEAAQAAPETQAVAGAERPAVGQHAAVGQNYAADAAAKQAAAAKAAAAKAQAAKAQAAKRAAAAPPATRSLGHYTKLQPNFYYCGPAATRVALTAHGKTPSFDQLAAKLGTTTNGTNSAYDITRVLNGELGQRRYHTTEIPGQKATWRQVEQLRSDVVTSLNQGDPVVANIAGTVTDTAGDIHSYEGGHYLTVTGYSSHGQTVTISDPADTVGSPEYQLSVKDLANWIATRGYSS